MILLCSIVFGYQDYNFVMVMQCFIDYLLVLMCKGMCELLWKVCVKCVIFVIGVYEWLIVFGNNDLLGVMLVGVVLIYVYCFGVLLGCNVVVFMNNDCVYQIVFDLKVCGVKVMVVDFCVLLNGVLLVVVKWQGVMVMSGVVVMVVLGKWCVLLVDVVFYLNGQIGGKLQMLLCDFVVMLGGFSLVLYLFV